MYFLQPADSGDWASGSGDLQLADLQRHDCRRSGRKLSISVGQYGSECIECVLYRVFTTKYAAGRVKKKGIIDALRDDIA